MTIEKSPLLSPTRSRWVADDLYQLLNEVMALRASANALEALRKAELAGRQSYASVKSKAG